jgi:hypothetical protein
MDSDILTELDRILDKTPEHAYATPPVARRIIAAAAAEIRTLRARLAAANRSQTQEAAHAAL